jgi:hypothetical protein
MELVQTITPLVEIVPAPSLIIPTACLRVADLGFITDYADYADVVEAPRMMHKMVATQMIATILNSNGVTIPNGAVRYSLDMWTVLLSGSGGGRSTLVRLGDDVWQGAKIGNPVRSADWGSGAAVLQDLAEHPSTTGS